MADNDNTEETKPADSASSSVEEEAGMSSDQSFTYWMTMLPFLAIAAVFVYEFSKVPDNNKLINAAGAVVVGIFVASFVNVLTQGSDKKDDGAGPAEAPKAEGSS